MTCSFYEDEFFPVDNADMPTILTKIELCDKSKLCHLIKNKYMDSKWRKLYKAYLKKCWVQGNEFRVEYTYSKYSYENTGRLFCRNGLGLQAFPRDVRAYLCGEFYDDIDQVNSMPVLLAQVFESYNISVPELEEYVNNRSAFLDKEHLTKKDVLSQLLTSYKPPSNSLLKKIHADIYTKLVPILQKEGWSEKVWTHLNTVRHKVIKGNLPGCFLSLVMQTHEHETLNEMFNFFESMYFSPDVPVFDGGQVRKDPSRIITQHTLDKCEAQVLNNAAFSVKLAIKPMEVSPEFYTKYHISEDDLLDDDEQNVEKDLDMDEYVMDIPDDEEFHLQKLQRFYNDGYCPNRAVAYLNNFLAKITHESTVFYCWRDSRMEPWLLRDKSTTRGSLSHRYLKKKVKTEDSKKCKYVDVPMFNVWDENPFILTFKRVVMNPTYTGDINFKELNLFRGFKAKRLAKYDPQVIEPILHHIKYVINSDNQEHADYTLSWLAHIVQHPEEKNRTALVLYGNQGTGKNILFEFFGEKIIGRDHYLYLNNLEDLTGQFTSLSAAKIFVLGDEISFAGGYRTNSIIKSKVTQSWQKLEKKGVDPVMIDDFMNLCFLSNHDDCMRIEDTDRRYFVKRTSSKHRNDHEYFNALAARLTHEAANHFYTYLMERDLSAFNVRDIPETEEKQSMKIYAKAPLELFADDLLNGQIKINSVVTLCADSEEEEEEEEGEHGRQSLYFERNKTYETTINVLFNLYREYVDAGFAGRKAGADLPKIAFSRAIRKHLKIENKSGHRHNGTPILLTVASPTEV
ncbi:hypothetical protein BC832DRAFT_595777 [Gaertneriomyces semiglobifer]|nr:hypothetical protein BC832DRAFT_595777 [Gaertneriomyces semiglobifer]